MAAVGLQRVSARLKAFPVAASRFKNGQSNDYSQANHRLHLQVQQVRPPMGSETSKAASLR
jgi:hypothetical protein